MSETGELMDRPVDPAIETSLQQFSQLPGWLAAARDAERVCRELAATVPEFCAGEWELKGCDVGHVLYKDLFWTAHYELTARKTGDSKNHTIKLQGRIFPPGSAPSSQPQVSSSLGASDWLAFLPGLNLELQARQPETVLAALTYLTEPEESRQFLESSIRSGTPALGDVRIKACTPRVVRYKPGSRCTVVFSLDYEPGMAQQKGWPDLVVAKTYRGDKGQTAYDSMAAIWESPVVQASGVRVARPLAYLPEVKVLVQGPVPEEMTLKSLLYQAVDDRTPDVTGFLDRILRKTAAGLAALHRSGLELGRAWTWDDGLDEVRDQVKRLADAIPDLHTVALPLLNRLGQLAAEVPPDPPVPSHGTFRPAQVLIQGDQIGFIDFDSFCQSEPANDLALFLGTVMTICLTPLEVVSGGEAPEKMAAFSRAQRYDFAAALSEDFLKEYARHHPVSFQRVALWEALDIVMFLLHAWTKIKVTEIEDLTYLLGRFMADHGIGGAR